MGSKAGRWRGGEGRQVIHRFDLTATAQPTSGQDGQVGSLLTGVTAVKLPDSDLIQVIRVQ